MASKKQRKEFEDDKELFELANRLVRERNKIKSKIRSYKRDLKCIEMVFSFLSMEKKTILGTPIKELIEDYINGSGMLMSATYDMLTHK